MTRQPTLAIVAGSGLDLSTLLDEVTGSLSFCEVPGLPLSSVPGHDGCFVFGRCGGVFIVLQCGRVHLYEGHAYAAATCTVDALAGFGVQTVLFTNAAGGLVPDMAPGDLMAAERLLLWPFCRWSDSGLVATDGEAEAVALASVVPDIALPGCDWSGAYVWVHGPCYETRAEIAALQQADGSAVGMSTAPEVSRCGALGLRSAVVSCITNNCCRPQTLSHDHVLKEAASASQRLVSAIRAAVPTL